MGEYLLGIDIGTSACKIAVFAKDGTVRATGTGDYQVYYPYPGWAEQNPEEWWSAVCKATKETIYKAGARKGKYFPGRDQRNRDRWAELVCNRSR